MIYFIYVAAICAANMSANHFGPAITPVNSFLLIGLDFVVRDRLHERVGIVKMFLLIAVAGAISVAIDPSVGVIPAASVISFIVSSVVDTMVYQALIRKAWAVKSNGSNIAGAAVDSLVFPAIAFGAFMPAVVLGQFFAKVIGGLMWSYFLRVRT